MTDGQAFLLGIGLIVLVGITAGLINKSRGDQPIREWTKEQVCAFRKKLGLPCEDDGTE